MNPILQTVEDSVDQIVADPGDKDQYDRIVLAGKKIMFDEATHDKISWMQEPSDLAALVTGVFDLMAIIGEVSKNTMKADPAKGAAVSLVIEALDFAERAQGLEITEEIVQAAVQLINEKMNAQDKPAEQPPAQPPAQTTAQTPAQGLINAQGV